MKDSATGNKLFYTDLIREIPAKEKLEFKEEKKRKLSQHLSEKREAGHIAKASEWSSFQNIPDQLDVKDKWEKPNPKNVINEVRHILNEEELSDADYEKKLIEAHPRNKKYLERIKTDF